MGEATCSTACQTTCMNNQGINDAIRHLQGTITKVVSSQNNQVTTPAPTGPATTKNTNPTTSNGSKSTTTQNNANIAPHFNIPYYLILCSNIIMILNQFC